MTDRISRHQDIILEAINEYDQWMQDDDYDAQPVLDRIIRRMRERIEIEADPSCSGPSYLDFITPDEVFDRGPDAVKEWQDKKAAELSGSGDG